MNTKTVATVTIAVIASVLFLSAVAWAQTNLLVPWRMMGNTTGTPNPGYGMMRGGTGGMMQMMGGSGAGNDKAWGQMQKMHNDPKFKAMHEQCEKIMGADMDKMHQQMHGTASQDQT